MRISIRKQFAFIFIILIVGVMIFCWLINSLFLEDYYLSEKKQIIYDSYEEIKIAARKGGYYDADFNHKLTDICNTYNITICVTDMNSNVGYGSINGGERLYYQLMGYVFDRWPENYSIEENNNDYKLLRIVEDGNEFLEMFGRFDSGISFIIRTPCQSVHESARIATRFLYYVCLAAAVIGGIIIWFVAGKITKPIRKLNEISEKMVGLDFNIKYEENAHNEIDLLGDNINTLSASLEKSISELKTANNELQRDIEKKERIDEMRKEFLSNVSHELKTPLALIMGYTEGLMEGITDDESRDFYCEVIMDESKKMDQMVKKLLNLTQLEFGYDKVNMVRFDIVDLIKNYLQSAEILYKQNDIQVRMDNYDAVYVWADEFKTEEVLSNYFSNAINHCAGERYIEISLEKKETKIRISVFNTGENIPMDSIQRIWEKFYKVDKARTREYGGSGVGLSIVKAIMESMNQEYGVENYANGVMFWFELELA
ncbi:MAG: HAMP domain-containing histidine kinase [bacterium]|nr:HAMP domain-containing histidine kinase [bacterium]